MFRNPAPLRRQSAGRMIGILWCITSIAFQ
jgi:hypothetical protein